MPVIVLIPVDEFKRVHAVGTYNETVFSVYPPARSIATCCSTEVSRSTRFSPPIQGPKHDWGVWEICFCQLGSGQLSHIFLQLVTASQMVAAPVSHFHTCDDGRTTVIARRNMNR